MSPNLSLVVEPAGNITVYTGETLYLDLNTTHDREVTYQISPSISGMKFDIATGVLTWTPEQNQSGTYPIIITASDGEMTSREKIQMTVVHRNRAPSIEPLGPLTMYAGEIYEFGINATDPDGDTLYYYSGGLPSFATMDNTTGIMQWFPPVDMYWTSGFRIVVSDGHGESAQQVVEYSVLQKNMAPTPSEVTLERLIETLPDDTISPSSITHTGKIIEVFNEDHGTLQSYIENAADEDTILVHNNTYHGSINLHKAVKVIGIGNPTIDAGGEGTVVSMTTGGATIAGFTLINAGNDVYDSGIKVSSGRNVIVTNNIIGTQRGIYLLYPADSNIIKNNTILNSTLEGIYGANIHGMQVQYNNVLNNQQGIVLEGCSNVRLADNLIAYNRGHGLVVNDSRWDIISGNLIEYNDINGIYMFRNALETIEKNTVLMNKRDGIMLEETADPELRGNQITEFPESEFISRVRDNTCNWNRRGGIILYKVTAFVERNSCYKNSYGIRAIDSDVRLDDNSATFNSAGIIFTNMETSVIHNTVASDNMYGMYFEGKTTDNSITENTITSSSSYGIYFGPDTKGNIRRDNVFFGNIRGEIVDLGENI